MFLLEILKRYVLEIVTLFKSCNSLQTQFKKHLKLTDLLLSRVYNLITETTFNLRGKWKMSLNIFF